MVDEKKCIFRIVGNGEIQFQAQTLNEAKTWIQQISNNIKVSF